MSTSEDYRPFKVMEWEAWQQRAPHYVDRLGQVTAPAAAHLLDAVQPRIGMRLLDICCGPGQAAAVASAKGLSVVGIDFAPAMVDEGRRRFPGLDLRIGDAEALDFTDGSFDAAICAFGLLHLPDAGRGLAEAFRVVKAGGSYAFCVWCAPDKAKLLGLVMDVVSAHVDKDIALPPGPPFFHFSDPEVSVRALERAGFRDIVFRDLPLVYEGPSPEDFLDWFEKSTVRMSALYRLQTSDVQARIRDALLAGARCYATQDAVRIPCPAIMFSGRKPACRAA